MIKTNKKLHQHYNNNKNWSNNEWTSYKTAHSSLIDCVSKFLVPRNNTNAKIDPSHHTRMPSLFILIFHLKRDTDTLVTKTRAHKYFGNHHQSFPKSKKRQHWIVSQTIRVCHIRKPHFKVLLTAFNILYKDILLNESQDSKLVIERRRQTGLIVIICWWCSRFHISPSFSLYCIVKITINFTDFL